MEKFFRIEDFDYIPEEMDGLPLSEIDKMIAKKLEANKDLIPKELPVVIVNRRIEPIVLNTYQVWCEGFSLPYITCTAFFLGESVGANFRQAAESLLRNNLDRTPDGSYNIVDECLTIFGCKVFDNEQQARQKFG